MADIELRRGVRVPETELDLRASRSSGPGGQSVNTTSSKIELRWNVRESGALTPVQRQRVLEQLSNRITGDGVLILTGSEYKSQHQNSQAVRARFRAIVSDALEPPTPRRTTRVSRSQKRKRLDNKRKHSDKKRLRRPPG